MAAFDNGPWSNPFCEPSFDPFDRQDDIRATVDEFMRHMAVPPDAKKCETLRELGDWFKTFAHACHAALPRAPK